MLKVSEATLAKIDAIEAEPAKKGAKMPDIRGGKVQRLVDMMDEDSAAHAEIERLQIQLATLKSVHEKMQDEHGKEMAEAEDLAVTCEDMKHSIQALQDKLKKAKELADSRNKIIRAFKSIVDEVGF